MSVTVSFNRNQYQIENANYYVAPVAFGGSDSNPGTISQPFATLAKAESVVTAGQLVYFRGGTYTVTHNALSKDGTSGNYIRFFAYPGETPLFDASADPTAAHNIIRGTNRSWRYFKGLEIYGATGSGVRFDGTSTNIIVENCNCHHNVRIDSNGAGIEFDNTYTNVQLLNNDCHHQSYHLGGSGGDGIGFYDSQSTGNILRGNRMWRNNDDGLDMWNAANVLVESNWAWENGYDDDDVPQAGDGNGIKLGGGGTGDGNHTVRYNLSWRNKVAGFDQNSADNPMVLYHNTGWGNARVSGNNYHFGTAVAHTLRNNIAYNPNGVSFNAAVIHDHNSWNAAVGVTIVDATFLSMDFTANIGARQSDGSLPVSNFLKLDPSAPSGNNCVDKGVDVGLPFNGGLPDLGAYES